MASQDRAAPPRRGGAFTVREIEGATKAAEAAGKDMWLTDAAPRGTGRFTCRCTPAGGRIFMFRYVNSRGERDALRVAAYDPGGKAGSTLDEARRKAGEWSRLYQAGTLDLREHFEALELAAQEATAASARAREDAQRRANRGSLSALVDAYVKTLEGRQSAYDARNLLTLHVKDAFPELAALPAAAIEAEQLRDVLARLIEAKKGRTAAKLRAYLRAAYSLAMRAGLDPTVPEELAAFDVKHNPLERLPSLAQFSKALDRALTLPELVAFWRRVRKLPDSPAKDALQACVLLGGQRPAQLLRVARQAVDLSAGTIALLDIKGRNRHDKPRRHVLPIPADLMATIKRRANACETPEALLFGSTHQQTLSDLVAQLSADMAAAKELERGPFQLRDLRRTAETHLAAMGVSSDVRAQLQSHGLGGIQQRHYDRHDYMAEKAAALAKWAGRLKSRAAPKKSAKVVPIKRARAAA